jgi:hypothetical protein
MAPLAVALAAAAVAIGAAGCGGTPAAAPVTTTSPPATAAPATEAPTTTQPTTTTSMPPALPDPSPPIPSPGTNKILVVGDSVILGAKEQVPKDLPFWDVTFDAVESRFITQGMGVIKSHVSAYDTAALDQWLLVVKAYQDAGKPPPAAPAPPSMTDAIGRVVVLHLCTNYLAGGGFDRQIQAYMDYLKDLDRVVWVTCGEWGPGQVEANQAIRAAAATNPKIVVADWARYAPTPGYTYDDHIHLRPPGQEELAQLVARAVGPPPALPPPPPPTTLPPPTSTTTAAPPPPKP